MYNYKENLHLNVLFFLSGTPMVFTINKQKCTTLMFAEAKYVSMSDGMKKVA